MRKPRFRRDNPKARIVQPPPHGVDLAEIARKCRYESSPYHTAGRQRRPRPDASRCPPELSRQPVMTEGWLRESIEAGRTGTWDGGFPRYVWCRINGTIFEARQGTTGSGLYHGYPLQPEQRVRGLR